MHRLFVKIAFIGFVASFIGGFGLFLSHSFHSPSEAKIAFGCLLSIGISGILLFALNLFWLLIKRMIYDVVFASTKAVQDAKLKGKECSSSRKKMKKEPKQ